MYVRPVTSRYEFGPASAHSTTAAARFSSVALRYSRNPGLTWSRNDSTVSRVIHSASVGLTSDFSISPKTRCVYS